MIFSKGRGPGGLLLIYVYIARNTCCLVGREMLVRYFSPIFKNGQFHHKFALVENLSVK